MLDDAKRLSPTLLRITESLTLEITGDRLRVACLSAPVLGLGPQL